MSPPVVHARRARSPSPRLATGGVKTPAQIAGEARGVGANHCRPRARCAISHCEAHHDELSGLMTASLSEEEPKNMLNLYHSCALMMRANFLKYYSTKDNLFFRSA